MGLLKKGIAARQNISTQARAVFNKRGIGITLNELATDLNLGISYITNHYRTKDHLFVAIAHEYDMAVKKLMQDFDFSGEVPLRQVVVLYSRIMDLQYEYRSGIVAVVISSKSHKIMYQHVAESYKQASGNVKEFTRMFVHKGLLESSILKRGAYEVFHFQQVNLFTTWMINLELYDNHLEYQKVKPIYLKGIINLFLPYFTPAGMEQYQQLNFNKLAK